MEIPLTKSRLTEFILEKGPGVWVGSSAGPVELFLPPPQEVRINAKKTKKTESSFFCLKLRLLKGNGSE